MHCGCGPRGDLSKREETEPQAGTLTTRLMAPRRSARLQIRLQT